MRQRAAMRLKIILLKLAVIVLNPLTVKDQNNLLSQLNRILKVLLQTMRSLVNSKIKSLRRKKKKNQKNFQNQQ